MSEIEGAALQPAAYKITKMEGVADNATAASNITYLVDDENQLLLRKSTSTIPAKYIVDDDNISQRMMYADAIYRIWIATTTARMKQERTTAASMKQERRTNI